MKNVERIRDWKMLSVEGGEILRVEVYWDERVKNLPKIITGVIDISEDDYCFRIETSWEKYWLNKDFVRCVVFEEEEEEFEEL